MQQNLLMLITLSTFSRSDQTSSLRLENVVIDLWKIGLAALMVGFKSWFSGIERGR